MRVTGDCLDPEIKHGELLRFSKTAPYGAGDFVAIFLRPEAVPEGGHHVIVKKLALGVPDWVKFPWRDNPRSEIHPIVIFEQTNPPRQYRAKCAAILGIHKVVERGMSDDRVRWPS
jgi:hypothetical protein